LNVAKLIAALKKVKLKNWNLVFFYYKKLYSLKIH